mgnify:CR=1 FL=1
MQNILKLDISIIKNINIDIISFFFFRLPYITSPLLFISSGEFIFFVYSIGKPLYSLTPSGRVSKQLACC